MQGIGSELELLARSTEGDFLSMGEVLQDFHERTSGMSRISASVGRLMAGEEIGAVIDGFRRVTGRIETLETGSRRSATMLRRLLETRSHLGAHLAGFQKTIRSLRVLCVSTRIESARLGERDIGFSTLADEVGKLALEIEEKCSHLTARTESLSDLVGQALRRVSDLETRQHSQVAFILGNTMSNLESLTERHGLSARCATDVSSRYQAVSRSIGEIVTSLQFHDITRQRIEHAKKALDRIVSGEEPADVPRVKEEGAEENAGSECGGRWKRRLISSVSGRWKSAGKAREVLRLGGDICALQIAQLCNARDVMVSAVENILDNMQRVADVVGEAAQETRGMAGAADETGRSFLEEVEAGLSSVASAFSAYAETDRELSSVIASVGETLGDMSAHTGVIEAIGEKIKLIALNAIVKASHIGDEGATLSVLAEAIHRLSAETRQQTATVSDALRSMTSESESLTAVVASDGEAEASEAVPLEEELGSLLNGLRNVERDIVSLLTRMNDEGSALSKDILSTLGEVRVHHRVDEAINGVASRLGEIVAASRSPNALDSRPGAAGYMQTLEASYTMREERDVHRSLVGDGRTSGDAEPGRPGPPAASGAGGAITDGEADGDATEDLGDNVELF